MEHSEAVRTQATEKYLLGEMTGAERDAFEAHFFDCPECAAEVRAGATFVENTRQVLAEDAGARRRSRSPLRLFWPMPIGAAAALLLALGLSAHLALGVVPRLRGELETAESLAPTSQHFLAVARSETPEVVVRPGQRAFALTLSRSSDSTFPFYRCEVHDARGRVTLSSTLPAPPDGEIQLLVPTRRLDAGSYAVVVSGLHSPGGPAAAPELARYPFTLRHNEE